MRFKIVGDTYSLVFHHSLPVDPKETIKMSYQPNLRDIWGETEAILFRIDKNTNERIEIDRAKAYCSPEDNYVKSIGRKMALQRLFKQGSIDWMHDKGSKKRFWMIYFAKISEIPE